MEQTTKSNQTLCLGPSFLSLSTHSSSSVGIYPFQVPFTLTCAQGSVPTQELPIGMLVVVSFQASHGGDVRAPGRLLICEPSAEEISRGAQ